MKSKPRIVCAWFIFVWLPSGMSKFCERSTKGYTVDSLNETDAESDSTTTIQANLATAFTCPQPHDPQDFTECCWNSVVQCCPAQPAFHQIDDQLVMVVGLIVINTCLFLTILIVVCCFWSHCPLYNTCRVNYTQGDIIAYSKEDDPLNAMPPEDKDGQHHYSPSSIKIKPVEDV